MKREKVKSSTLASVGYDAEQKYLDVEFVQGGLYRYFDVPRYKFKRLMKSESRGKFFIAEIKDNYRSDRISKLDYITRSLTDGQKKLLLEHFNSIYECNELAEHEYRIIYLAWLWTNGFVYREQNGMSNIDKKTSDLPLSAFEINFEDDDKGGVNLDLTYNFYGLDEIISFMKW